MLRHQLAHHPILFVLGQRPDLPQFLRHIDAQRVQHGFEQAETFGLVLIQRVTLGIAAKADDRAQMFQRQQMFAPFAVDGLQQQLLFDVAHGLDAKRCGLFRHEGVGRCQQPFAHRLLVHALFPGPGHHRHIDAQPFDHCGIQPLAVPLFGIAFRRQIAIDQIVDHLVAHVAHDLFQILRLHDLAALAKDHLALVVHHIVILQQLLADVEVAAFNLGLRLFQRLVHPGVDDRLTFLHPQRRQHLVQPFRPEDPHQIVFKAQVERRPPGVTLTARPAAQLIVDPPAFVAFGGQHEQTTGGDHFCFFVGMFSLDPGADLVGMQRRVGGNRLQHQHFHVAAQLDIGAAPGHVGGDGDSGEFPGVGDDLGFLFVLAGVQHIMRHPGSGQQAGQRFRFFDRGGADQQRLALFMGFLNGFHHRLVFLAPGAVDRVMFVLALHQPVGRHLDHAQFVDLGELIGFGGGGAGHPGQFTVQAEIVLKGDRGQRHVFRLNLRAFLGLDRLMQAIRQPPTTHHPAGKLVDQHHFVVLDDILLVAVEQFVRPQPLIDMVNDGGAFGIIQRLFARQNPGGAQPLFQKLVALFGKGDVAGFFVQLEMVRQQFGNNRIHRFIQVGPVGRGAGNDQRRPRLVDQDAVHFIDNRVEVMALVHFGQISLHVVAQVVEPQFVVGGIGDVGGVSALFLGFGLLRIDDPGGQPQLGIDLAHPFGVALGQIVVDRHDMHALARQRVQIGRKGRHQRLAFTGFHLGDIALMQENPAHQLHIKRPQAQRAFRGFAAIGKGFGQQIIQAFTLDDAGPVNLGAGHNLGIAQRGKLRLHRGDFRHQGACRLDLAVVRRAKDFFGQCSKAQHVLSASRAPACI